MRKSALVVAIFVATICAAGYWADGSSLGELIVNSSILGAVAFLQMRDVEKKWLQVSIALVYLSSVALGAVCAELIDKTLGFEPSENLLQGSTVIPAVLLAWAVCHIFLRTRFAPDQKQQPANKGLVDLQ